jgi:hypothetical protein
MLLPSAPACLSSVALLVRAQKLDLCHCNFHTLKNAITKTRLGDMSLQLLHTSVYAIVVIPKSNTVNNTQIRTCILIYGQVKEQKKTKFMTLVARIQEPHP